MPSGHPSSLVQEDGGPASIFAAFSRISTTTLKLLDIQYSESLHFFFIFDGIPHVSLKFTQAPPIDIRMHVHVVHVYVCHLSIKSIDMILVQTYTIVFKIPVSKIN